MNDGMNDQDEVRQRDDRPLTDAVQQEIGRGNPFAAVLRATHMAMLITDPTLADNPIVFANDAFQQLTGYRLDEVLGRNCRFLQGPATDRAAIARVHAAIAAGDSAEVDLLNYRKDGSTFWNALYLSPIKGDDGAVKFFFASQLDVTDRIEAQTEITREKHAVEEEVRRRTAELEAALDAKTLLLHELDHRVKNNLGMIGALLRLQASQIDDTVVAAKINAMMERLGALAIIHRRLYQTGDVHSFDIGAFLGNLVADVMAASGRTDIALKSEIETILIPSNRASPLGLILNEILSNAMHHGFADERPGTLRVVARLVEGGGIVTIGDDGHGMKPEPVKDGLGRTLINRLSRQLGAQVTWTDANPGTTVTVIFSLGK